MQREFTDARHLYVTTHWPWPQRMGARRRAAATVLALRALGHVDVLYLDQGWRNSWSDEAPEGVRQAVTVLPAPGRAAPEPIGLPEPEPVPEPVAELRRGARPQVAAWLAEHDYELVWCNRIITWWVLRGLLRSPTVVDVDDLNDRLVLQQARAEGRIGASETHREVASWRRLHALLAAEADCLVVCSAADQARLGTDRAVVVPNVFLGPAGTGEPGGPGHPDRRRPRILLQGDFTYRPNILAAHRLATAILPRVRRLLPRAQVWLVGRHTGALDPLAGRDVSVFGQVRDMAGFVAAADMVAVPLTEGSGTRIKILEAWQLERPVVSTGQGAEGLAAETGRHLMLAESDDEFAAAVVAVATQPKLASRLVRAGKALVRDRHGYPALLAGVTAAVETALHRPGAP
jgi:Glycosyl transferases group 1